MCVCWDRLWTCLHVLWAVVYVCAGAVQIITGIFFLITLPALRLCSNVWAGSWNVVAGIGGGMLVCFGETTPQRQEKLLYMSISILVANTVNAVLTEWTFYSTELLLQSANYTTTTGLHNLIVYARLTAGIAAGTVLVTSFLDTQLTFCSIDATRAAQKAKFRKVPGSNDQVSDIEYIIPRPKSNSQSRPANSSGYSQSWVFEAENSNSNNTASPYLKLSQDNDSSLENGKDTSSESAKIASEETIILANPVVHIEEASDESNSNSDRKLCYMKSFSRSPSPAVLSAASSQTSLENNPPIYECLEKLTEASVYRSRLNTALSAREDGGSQATSPKKPDLASPRASDHVQYASLMMELEQALSKKEKSQVILSPDTQTNSNSNSQQDESSSVSESHHTDFKSSDTDFSKELEAALQLIQDLESPNTIETPSETCGQKPLAVWQHSDASGSEKTLSAVGSLAELTSPMVECLPELRRPSLNGKIPTIVIQCSDSQSTSGYSSPTRKWTPDWSANSSIDGSSADLYKTNFTIKTTNATAVISLHDTDPSQNGQNKSVTVITLNNDDVANNNVDDKINRKAVVRRSFSVGGSLSPWNVKSLLRKKKPVPKLSAELESAIVKSESLAHLTDLELLAWHERNREIQRQIEQRVQQQLVQTTESNC